MQDNHKISPLAPSQFLDHRCCHAFPLELFWQQVCFNLHFVELTLLSLLAVTLSFLPVLPPEQNDVSPPLDTLPCKLMFLQISQ